MLLSERIQELQDALDENGDGELVYSFPTDDGRSTSYESEVVVMDDRVVVMIYSN